MNAYIPSKEELELFIDRAVAKSIMKYLPDAIRKATRKKWLSTDDVMEMLQCSRRHVQHLRDTKQIPFMQNGRLVRYDVEDIEDYLNRHKIS